MSAISLESVYETGVVLEAPRVVIYGPHGVGKTCLAAAFPSPIFLQTERGEGVQRFPTFGLLESWGDVYQAFAELYSKEHPYKTVVLDSLDWFEPLVHRRTMEENNWKDMEKSAGGYGKGYAAADLNWRKFLTWCESVRLRRGMTIVLIAHQKIKRYEDPMSEGYDRYMLALKDGAKAILAQYSDEVWFLNWRVSLRRSEDPKGKAKGVGGGVRVLHTEERPAYEAKHRFPMPETIDLPNSSDPDVLRDVVTTYVPFFNSKE